MLEIDHYLTWAFEVTMSISPFRFLRLPHLNQLSLNPTFQLTVTFAAF